jgi:putative FmdB family regulatory protein
MDGYRDAPRGAWMPTYEYRCQACSHELEAFQSIKDAPLTNCPVCHQPRLERLISLTAFQLKGGGWYKDLYSSSKPTSSSSETKKSETKKSETTKSEKAA